MNAIAYQSIQTKHRQYALCQAVKKALLALLLGTIIVLAFVLTAQAADRVDIETFYAVPHLDNTQKLIFLSGLAMMDYHQTESTVVEHPNKYHEMNPVLGKHPSRGALVAFGIIGVTATALISQIDHPLAQIVVDSIIATEYLNVWENTYKIDQRSSMPIMIVASFKF